MSENTFLHISVRNTLYELVPILLLVEVNAE